MNSNKRSASTPLLMPGQHELVNRTNLAVDKAFALHAGSFKLSVAVGVVVSNSAGNTGARESNIAIKESTDLPDGTARLTGSS
jgi:hypothetical protein